MKPTQFGARFVVWLSLSGVVLSACGRAAELCDAMCECELCSDRKLEECEISTDTAIDEADAYDCADDFDAYLQCQLDEADCDEHNWRVEDDSCDSERDDYVECVSDASDLGVVGGGTSCVCSCTCEQGSTISYCSGTGCCGGQCMAQCQTDGFGVSVSAEELCE